MTNRPLITIVKNQHPLILNTAASVAAACAAMCRCHAGSVLVVDEARNLCGIFTGRDAVRVLANTTAPDIRLADVMTKDPITIEPRARAVDALRIMSDGGFRHLPVVDGGRIWGIVSRSDFLGAEIEHLDEDDHLAECIW